PQLAADAEQQDVAVDRGQVADQRRRGRRHHIVQHRLAGQAGRQDCGVGHAVLGSLRDHSLVMKAAPRSATMKTVAQMLLATRSGKTEASQTRSASMPRTLRVAGSTTASESLP